MARVRWARKCAARRRNGLPCGNYAISGGKVCRVHGGSARQVRRAAQRRLLEASAYRALAAAMERLKRERTDWAVARVLAASDVLGIAVEQLVRSDVWSAAAISDHPDLHAPEPRLRFDRRFGPRGTAATQKVKRDAP
ncbi:MAG TPA: hypothetical protein VFA06_03075 [Actinocrinis sp.]|uniref:hypothetical protein n=1 Tax=Actinocrinis sp. TaxID=1920516 RepID=UPI002D3D6555|nr:hypothetical protein [Actinocrinis sp.]HZU54831.1 hypothetical protein [Actinocrinis sp.]